MDSTHLRYIQQQWSCRSDRESHLLWQKDLQENAEEKQLFFTPDCYSWDIFDGEIIASYSTASKK